MSIKIILDDKLENKTITSFDKLQIQSILNLDNPDLYFSQYEHTENILIRSNNDYRTNNNFINAFLDAYNYHKTLVIRPDDIKLQLLMIISTCVNNNPEKFRSYFVNHTDKKELIIRNANFDADYFCNKFAELLEENIKDKEFAQQYTTKFTTTNQIISTVNNITLMNTLKEYFSFTMICQCGIPSVILSGTNDDWNTLFQTYDYFKKIFLDSELKNWFTHFDKIIYLFKKMRNDKIADNYICELWKRVISYIPQGSGGDKILGGWVRLFVPYNGVNKLIDGLDKEIACLDITKIEPNKKNYYEWQDKMKDFYLGAGWGEMLSSCVTTPAILIYDNFSSEYNVEFYSGFFPPYLSDLDEIHLNIGYMLREDQKIKKDKLKEFYINKGVKNKGFSLSIPRKLQKNIEEILDVFNKYAYSYYGVDPEEEARKQLYIDLGVKKEKLVFSYKLLIPKSLEEDKIKINEIKKLFNIGINRVEFY
jgi:hypothetical protein